MINMIKVLTPQREAEIRREWKLLSHEYNEVIFSGSLEQIRSQIKDLLDEIEVLRSGVQHVEAIQQELVLTKSQLTYEAKQTKKKMAIVSAVEKSMDQAWEYKDA